MMACLTGGAGTGVFHPSGSRTSSLSDRDLAGRLCRTDNDTMATAIQLLITVAATIAVMLFITYTRR